MEPNLERSARRARSLLAVARHPNTPPAEAQTAHRLARVLMLRMGLTDADLDVAPAYERRRPAPPPPPPAPRTPGRKWTVYERAQAAYAAGNDDWGGLHVRLVINGEEVASIADWVRRSVT